MDITDAAALYESGARLADVARALHTNVRAARAQLVDAGVTIRPRGQVLHGGMSEADVQKAVAMYEGGATLHEVERALYRGRKTIKAALIEAGVTIRPWGKEPADTTRDAAMVAMFMAGHVTVTDVAKRHDVNVSVVYGALGRAGLLKKGQSAYALPRAAIEREHGVHTCPRCGIILTRSGTYNEDGEMLRPNDKPTAYVCWRCKEELKENPVESMRTWECSHR